MEKIEIERTTLETELNKLDDLANKLENFDKKSEHLECLQLPQHRSEGEHSESKRQSRNQNYQDEKGGHRSYRSDHSKDDSLQEDEISPMDFIKVLKRQNEISASILKHQEKAELPKRELQKFDGSDVTE